MLHYRVEVRDTLLREYLESSNKNATYIAKTVQDQLIEVVDGAIIQQIIEEVKQTKSFTILLDETGISFENESTICW